MTNFPDGADFRLCRLVMDRHEPRDLSRDEELILETIQHAVAILQLARLSLAELPRLDGDIEHTPSDSIDELEGEIRWLNASAAEVLQRPEREAEELDRQDY
jgi:hypothetical protein